MKKMFENFEEINKIETAIKTCQDLEKDIQSTIKHVSKLNKKYNPLCKRYFLKSENYFKSQEEEVVEQNNLSTNKLFDPSEIHEENLSSEMKKEKRLLKEIIQGYSKINTKLIKIQRSVESISTEIKLNIKSENKKKSIFVLDHYSCSHCNHKDLS